MRITKVCWGGWPGEPTITIRRPTMSGIFGKVSKLNHVWMLSVLEDLSKYAEANKLEKLSTKLIEIQDDARQALGIANGTQLDLVANGQMPN